MSEWSRRSFVGLASGVPALAVATRLSAVAAPGDSGWSAFDTRADGGDVFLSGDGLHLTPSEHGTLLARLSEGRAIAADDYGLGAARQGPSTRFC